MDPRAAARDGSIARTSFRAEWAHRVAETIQVAIGEVLASERERFPEAILRLAASIPEPGSALEALWVAEKLSAFCSRCGPTFHQLHHSANHSQFCGLVLQAPFWTLLSSAHGARFALCGWLSMYLRGFDVSHRAELLPLRSAQFLRAHRHRAVPMGELCHRVGASRGPLVRTFTERYGLSPTEYHTRVRMREVLQVLVAGEKVDYAARRAGYGGEGSFYAAFERLTGFRPAEVRSLSPGERCFLLANRLEIDPAALRRQALAGAQDGRRRPEQRSQGARTALDLVG